MTFNAEIASQTVRNVREQAKIKLRVDNAELIKGAVERILIHIKSLSEGGVNTFVCNLSEIPPDVRIEIRHDLFNLGFELDNVEPILTIRW